MKKTFSIILAIILTLLLFTGCNKTADEPQEKPNNENTVKKDDTFDDILNKIGNSLTEEEIKEEYPVFNLVDEKDITKEPVSFDFNGRTWTLKFIYTDILYTDLWPSKSYMFEYGAVHISFRKGESYYLTNDGKIITPEEYENNYKTEDEYIPDCFGKQMLLPSGEEGRMIGNGLALDMTGEPGNYTLWLYNEKGELLTPTGYDAIGYFNKDGFAAVEKDHKIGFIDERGNVLLEPTIAYDEILFDGGLGRKRGTHFIDMILEKSFIIPINNKVVIVNIE